MRVKTELHHDEVSKIVGKASKELTDKCPDQLAVFPEAPCTNLGCPYLIKDPGYMNCTFVAGEAGAHTLDAIAQMMKLTREGVRLIERRGLKKLREGLEKLDAKQARKRPPARKPSPLSGGDNVVTLNKVDQLEDEGDVLSALDDRELG